MVGDFDSLDLETISYFRDSGVDIRKFPVEKDEIDSELGSVVAQEFGAKILIFTGVIGNRVDHSLGVLQLMYLLKSKDLIPYIIEKNFEIGILRNESLNLVCSVGEVWSILPLNGDVNGLTLEGFKYTLQRARMPFGKPFGISNETVSNRVKIEVEDGNIIFVRWRERPC